MGVVQADRLACVSTHEEQAGRGVARLGRTATLPLPQCLDPAAALVCDLKMQDETVAGAEAYMVDIGRDSDVMNAGSR